MDGNEFKKATYQYFEHGQDWFMNYRGLRTELQQAALLETTKVRRYLLPNHIHNAAMNALGYQHNAMYCIDWVEEHQVFLVRGHRHLQTIGPREVYAIHNQPESLQPFMKQPDTLTTWAADRAAELAKALQQKCRQCPYETICLTGGAP